MQAAFSVNRLIAPTVAAEARAPGGGGGGGGALQRDIDPTPAHRKETRNMCLMHFILNRHTIHASVYLSLYLSLSPHSRQVTDDASYIIMCWKSPVAAAVPSPHSPRAHRLP